MRTRSLYALVALVAAMLAAAGSAEAATTVANTNDSGPGSLRQAILGAPPGETIEVPAGTYTLTSDELTIEKSLTINGQGAGATIVRSGGNFRVFDISGSGNSVTLSNLTVRDGHEGTPGGIAEGGGIRSEGAGLTLRNDLVTANRADVSDPSGGGGIAEGGGVYSEHGALTIEGTKVTGNGALAVGGGGNPGGIAEAGGVAFFGGQSLTIRNSQISENTADVRATEGGPGGIAEAGGAYLELEKSTATAISGLTVSRNSADASASSGPGGISEGGGLVVESESPGITLSNLTVAENSARAPGNPGGIVEGGGIVFSLSGGATAELLSTTIAGNEADAPGGIVKGGNILVSPGVKLANSIVSGGKAPAGTENCSEKLESLGFNIESTDQCGLHVPGDKVNTDPLLGPLQENGGPGPTMAPAFNSPAVDQGAAFGLGSDERGVVRPIDFPTIPNSSAPGADGSDIGAVELQPSNAFALGKLTKNKKKGSAKLQVRLPLPSFGTVTLTGKGLKPQSTPISGQETVTLPVIATGKAKKALRRRGKRKVLIQVTYSPTGNAAATLTRKAKLVRKHKKHKHRGHKHHGHKKR